MKVSISLFFLVLSLNTTGQTPIENKSLGIRFTPSPQIENTKDLETFIADLGKVELVYLEGNCVDNFYPNGNNSDTTCFRKSVINNHNRSKNLLSWDSSFYTKRKFVNDQDISDIFELLYGTKFSPKIGSSVQLGCYQPRNGIVFYNKENVAFGFLEICFECHGFELTSEIPAMKSTITDEELKIFKNLFTKNGIQTSEKDVFEYERFNLEFKTSKTTEEQEALTQFLDKVNRLEFVRLFADCEYSKMINAYINDENCYFQSIIESIKDSSFIVKKENFRQVVKVNKKDCSILFQTLYKENSVNNIYDLCYQPRNGIILYDKNKKAFAFIEICFECSGIKSAGPVPNINHPTSKVTKEIKELFDKYGVNTNEK